MLKIQKEHTGIIKAMMIMMTNKEYTLKREEKGIWYSHPTGNWYGNDLDEVFKKVEDDLNRLHGRIWELEKELNKLKKFEYGGEHIRLSINIETGELQRHIYATGQWFGDFDRVLVDNWLSKEDYQRFINRVIEVYNTEFKKELSE